MGYREPRLDSWAPAVEMCTLRLMPQELRVHRVVGSTTSVMTVVHKRQRLYCVYVAAGGVVGTVSRSMAMGVALATGVVSSGV